jgi:chromosomal replication initiation ATPase DnaA
MDTPRLLLEHYLKQLRLPTMMREFPKLGEQCAKEGATFEQFLLRLVEQEMTDRERRATERRIHAARFPVSKSLETYDFLAIPSLNKKLVMELARCEWIGRRENVLALGNSGTGKTHIGLALGLAACQQGLRVRFTTAAALVHELVEARDENVCCDIKSCCRDRNCSSWMNWVSCRYRKPVLKCCSKSLANAMNEPRLWSPVTFRLLSGPRSSDRKGSPGHCLTG